MPSFLRRQLLPAIRLLIVLTVLVGVAYPAAVTAVAQVAFPSQANGSMIVVDGKTVGSSLIGQAFNDPKYFWGRPSAAGTNGYDASGSAGSNLGPTSQDLINRITATSIAFERPTAADQSRSTSSQRRRRASTRTSVPPRPTTRSRGSPRPRGA